MNRRKVIKVIVCRPNEAPKIEEHTEELEEWQKLVNGYIDVIYPHDDDTCIILNDEGKIDNLPMNRPLKTADGITYDVICGTFIITRAPEDSESFDSLTNKQIEKYVKMYLEPITEEDTDALKPLSEPMIQFYSFI